jgi:hypothetical protein
MYSPKYQAILRQLNVGLMGFYSTAAAELQTFGFEMLAGEKSTPPPRIP